MISIAIDMDVIIPSFMPDGFYPDLDEAIYRADPAVAISDLKEMNLSPAHFWSKKFGGYRTEKSEAQEIGTLIHLATLEPERYRKLIISEPKDAPRRPTKAQLTAAKPSPATIDAIAFWEQWDKDNAGRTMLDEDQLARITGVSTAVRNHPDVAAMLVGAQTEVAMFATIIVDGVPIRVKGKADLFPTTPEIADLKTVDRGYANPDDFGKSIAKWAYDQQAAWYLDLNNHLVAGFFPGIVRDKWVFIPAEKEPPYACCTLQLDEESIEIGRARNQRSLKMLAQCFATNEWPGPSTSRGVVSLPQWRRKN